MGKTDLLFSVIVRLFHTWGAVAKCTYSRNGKSVPAMEGAAPHTISYLATGISSLRLFLSSKTAFWARSNGFQSPVASRRHYCHTFVSLCASYGRQAGWVVVEDVWG